MPFALRVGLGAVFGLVVGIVIAQIIVWLIPGNEPIVAFVVGALCGGIGTNVGMFVAIETESYR